ncbi:MAG: DNA polymerase [Synergistales bacterium]|nr:DNA polymerase [Synergistales bacterium]MDY6401419.1 DNA polymerase [Synergistales bacterium]MDY6404934.1 DNA polymerase [Synergistales bacterium]MDY6410369.1 DNA polymerase [Synergistales bacterium]MDY6422073.1 DNA polymerase [Synergistales bacterium]
MNEQKTFLIIDGHGLAYRGYYAIKANLSAPDGTPTRMLVGAMNALFKVQKEIHPDCTVIVFDAAGKTFRHELLPDYKAKREKTPDDFRIQLPILKDLLKFSGYKIISRESVEADDVIASLAKHIQNKGHHAVIFTSDKDLFQLLGTGVTMLRPVSKGNVEIYDVSTFAEEYKFMPSSMADFLAIAGDSVDNIKGVEGIGDDGAKKLLAQFPTIEEIYKNIDKIDTRNKNKLKAFGIEKTLWIRENLTKLRDNLFDDDVNILDECLNCKSDIEKAIELAERLALKKVLEHLKKNPDDEDDKTPPSHFVSHLPLAGEASSDTTWQGEAIKPECDLMTLDFKNELKDNPQKFADNPKIWDLKTAYYMLHPDTTGKKFPELLEELKSQDEIDNLAGKLEGEIFSHDGLHEVMTEIDLPLIPVLNCMEAHGVRIEHEKFSLVQKELEEKILEIEEEVINDAGVDINVNSPKQVSWLLFERLGFKPETKTKGKTSYSTDAAVLEKLSKLPNGKIPALILEHRELAKMLSGFVVPLQRAADADGIIHTTFLPASTGTGRLSSRDPNLQNIPAYGNWAEKIKSGLIPVEPGNIFVSADYSQIELRVLAYMSGEEKLIEAFRNQRDIHTETASWVFDTAPEFVTPELRRAAKMINFGLLYGMSSFGLAERLGISRREAAEIMKKYFDALPEIQNFLEIIVNDAKERGYSRTLAGRIRPVNEIPAWGAALDRALINSPVQGTAADIARRAMIKFAEKVPGKLFLQVHDSLVCECSEKEAGEIADTLSEIMKSSGGEINHLEVQIKSGKSLCDV